MARTAGNPDGVVGEPLRWWAAAGGGCWRRLAVALAHPAPGAPQALLLAAGVVYLIATVTRLGFFNIVSHDSGRFIGVPTTIAGLLWSALFLAEPGRVMATVGLLVTGTLMVLPVPIPRPTGWRFLLFPAWALGMMLLHAFR